MNLRPPAVYQLAVAVLILAAGGCTASSGRAVPARSPAITAATTVPPGPRAFTCGRTQIKTAVRRFFASWNRRDRVAFGRLFDADGAFAFAGKHQDTLRKGSDGGYTEVGGRHAVVALAGRQWVLGERLSYHGMTIYAGAYAGGGAEVNAFARFPGGVTQPLEEAKFSYDCKTGRFAHVVIISAGVAR
jgi:ketosteroid isomerase-like protein